MKRAAVELVSQLGRRFVSLFENWNILKGYVGGLFGLTTDGLPVYRPLSEAGFGWLNDDRGSQLH
jgi:hypothetical protein